MTDDIYRGHFVFAQDKPAWHRKGVELTGEKDIDEAMRLAKVSGWDIRMIPIAELAGGALIDHDTHILLRRNEDGVWSVLSDQLVRHSYSPIPNEVVFRDMVDFLAGMQFPVDAMGVLGSMGNRAFVTFDAGETQVAGNEKYKKYLVGIADHSGRGAARILGTSIRVVCANTERMAIAEAIRSLMMVTIPHNKNALDAFWESGEANRQVLQTTKNYQDALESMAEDMQAIEFDETQWFRFTNDWNLSLGEPETERQETIRRNASISLDDSWVLESKRAEALGQSATSLWTAKQAISTYVQHLSAGGASRRANRSLALMEGKTPGMMQRMHGVLKSRRGEPDFGVLSASRDGWRWL